MWQAVRENPRAVVYAVLMHLVLLVLLVFSLDWTPKAIKPGTNKPIQAQLVDPSKLKAIEEKKQAEQRRIEDDKRKAAAEIERKKKAEQDKKRKAEAERKKKAEQDKQRKAEVERKKKAEQDKQRKAEAEREKKAAAEAARREAAEEALQAQLAEETAQARAESALSQYIPYIQDKIQRNWLRPAGSPAGLSCLILVKLIPGGEVVDAKVVRSSGDPLFDRSVETAVLKASPLPLPEDAAMFKYFREINFNFNPDN